MTPTEQDKELREKLDRLIIENQSEDGSIDISDQRAMRDEIMQLITADRKRVALEARNDERNNCWKDFHKSYAVGDKSGDYIILGIEKKIHANNRKFRVECYWCGGVMFRYSNKFKVKHIMCNCWRDEAKRETRIAELQSTLVDKE